MYRQNGGAPLRLEKNKNTKEWQVEKKAKVKVLDAGGNDKGGTRLEPLPPIHKGKVADEREAMRADVEQFEKHLATYQLSNPRSRGQGDVMKLGDTYALNLIRSTSMTDIYQAYLHVMGSSRKRLALSNLGELFHTLVPHYPLGSDHLTAIFNALDEDGDGYVTFKELFVALGTVMYGRGTREGIDYFFKKIEGLGPLSAPNAPVPVTRFTMRHFEVVIKEHVPGSLVHKWFHLASLLCSKLETHPFEPTHIDHAKFVCYVYLYDDLSKAFSNIVPHTTPAKGAIPVTTFPSLRPVPPSDTRPPHKKKRQKPQISNTVRWCE